MQILNFPPLELAVRQHNGRNEIYDPVRKKYILLIPEEWVRQHVIAYLVKEKQVPLNLIAVEKTLKINTLTKRFDVVVFDRNAKPLMLIECKAPGIRVNESVFDQAARYNLSLKAGLFLITNGIEHYCCRIDFENKLYIFMNEIPPFGEMAVICAG
jgi:type I site-specific restriction endonuclease